MSISLENRSENTGKVCIKDFPVYYKIPDYFLLIRTETFRMTAGRTLIQGSRYYLLHLTSLRNKSFKKEFDILRALKRQYI